MAVEFNFVFYSITLAEIAAAAGAPHSTVDDKPGKFNKYKSRSSNGISGVWSCLIDRQFDKAFCWRSSFAVAPANWP